MRRDPLDPTNIIRPARVTYGYPGRGDRGEVGGGIVFGRPSDPEFHQVPDPVVVLESGPGRPQTAGP